MTISGEAGALAGGPLPLDLFDFELPTEFIATEPARPRDRSRMLVLDAAAAAPNDRSFWDLPDCLRPGDLLIVNRTQVLPARLALRRPSGGAVELLPYRPLDGDVAAAKLWACLGRPGDALRPSKRLVAPDGSELEVVERLDDVAHVRASRPMLELMGAYGEVPLPPYIRRPDGPRGADTEDYQAVFAADLGAVAAPTASLHFTDAVLQRLRAKGVGVESLVLHVGPGTFLPVRREHQDDVRGHRMHAEWYRIPTGTQAALERTRAAGGRVIAVGTTCVRALETWASTGAAQGDSRLFIYEGFRFEVVDGLITNFHLPRSTLLMLVSAFAGRDRILAAYEHAKAQRYRFYSFGDAMLLWRRQRHDADRMLSQAGVRPGLREGGGAGAVGGGDVGGEGRAKGASSGGEGMGGAR